MENNDKPQPPKTGFDLFDNIVSGLTKLYELAREDIKTFMIILLFCFEGYLIYQGIIDRNRFYLAQEQIGMLVQERKNASDKLIKSILVERDSLVKANLMLYEQNMKDIKKAENENDFLRQILKKNNK